MKEDSAFEKKMKSGKMGEKLKRAFLIVAIVASISGIAAAISMAIVTANFYAIVEDYGFAQGDIGRALVMVTDSRRALRDAVNYQNRNDALAALEELEEIRSKHDGFREDVLKSIKNQQAKQLWADVETALENYRLAQDKVVVMAGNITSNSERMEASKVLLEEVDPAYAELYDAYVALLNAKTDNGTARVGTMTAVCVILFVAVLVLIVVSVKVGTYIGGRVSTDITTPMIQCSERFKTMAKGDFSSPIPEVDTEDEIAEMIASLYDFKEYLTAVINDLQRGMNEMAKGNFNIGPEVEYPGDLEGIKNALGGFLITISETLGKIDVSSAGVADNADQIAQGAISITEGATDQAGAIQQLQATITDVTEKVDMNAKNAEAANGMAKNVGKEIMESNEQMQKMLLAMDEIIDNSNQINNIINTINDIASQTNLLALNASIEAARAGDVGKGFAVVADEVGNLASQSAQAAQNSTTLIANAIRAVENGKAIADITAEKLEHSASMTQELVSNIKEITEASVNQADALNQVTVTVEQIASVVEENTAMAEESSASSQELASQSQVLKALVSEFELIKM